MTRLRHIAVHVEEPKPRRFAWVLSERSGQDWQELDRSASHAASYQRAMADGLLALQALIPNLDIGPRDLDASTPAQDDASALKQEAGRTAEQREGGTKSAPAVGKSYFGFGPAR